MSTISFKDFKKALKSVGIKKNASCLIHASIINLGKFEDKKIANIPSNIFRLVKEAIGKNGTISVLSASYEYGKKKKKFNISSSIPTHEIGYFSKFVSQRKKSLRSFNPTFNISSEGKQAKFITSQKTPIAFGEDSAWHQLYKLNSEIIFIGCDLSVCTFVRFIEFRFGVPYLYNKLFNTKICNKKKIIFNYSSSPLRYKDSSVEYDLKDFQKLLIKKKILRVSKNKKINIMAMKMKPCFTLGVKELKKNVYFFLKSKPLFKKNFDPKE